MDRLDEVWSLVYEKLKQDINESTFKLWFEDLSLCELDEKRAVLSAKTVFKKRIL